MRFWRELPFCTRREGIATSQVSVPDIGYTCSLISLRYFRMRDQIQLLYAPHSLYKCKTFRCNKRHPYLARSNNVFVCCIWVCSWGWHLLPLSIFARTLKEIIHVRCFFSTGNEYCFRVVAKNSKYKTKLCDKYTITGLCPYGERCLFIHPNAKDSPNPYIRQDRVSFIDLFAQYFIYIHALVYLW